VTDPASTDFSFRGLGGLRDIKMGLYNCVTDLMSEPDGVAGGTLAAKPVAGVLLFGPPGKTIFIYIHICMYIRVHIYVYIHIYVV
jgi:ATP-dependent 26S proteasome regulatory subunit